LLRGGDFWLVAGNAEILDVLVWAHFIKLQQRFDAGEGQAAEDWP